MFDIHSKTPSSPYRLMPPEGPTSRASATTVAVPYCHVPTAVRSNQRVPPSTWPRLDAAYTDRERCLAPRFPAEQQQWRGGETRFQEATRSVQIDRASETPVTSARRPDQSSAIRTHQRDISSAGAGATMHVRTSSRVRFRSLRVCTRTLGEAQFSD